MESKIQSRSTATEDAVAILIADHKKVQKLFKEFEKLKEAGKSDDARAKIVEQVCLELTIHAQIEEEIFYPEAKAALKDKMLVPEATVEHAMIKELIAQIEGDEEGGEMYDAKIKVLSEYVKHHIKEEQGELFKMVKQSSLDLVELGDRMAERFEDLRAAKH